LHGRAVSKVEAGNKELDFLLRQTSDDELRKLSRAISVADMNTTGTIFYIRYLGSDWVGRDDFLDQAKRIMFKEAYCPNIDEDENAIPTPRSRSL
jgi:hypothetical protein